MRWLHVRVQPQARNPSRLASPEPAGLARSRRSGLQRRWARAVIGGHSFLLVVAVASCSSGCVEAVIVRCEDTPEHRLCSAMDAGPRDARVTDGGAADAAARDAGADSGGSDAGDPDAGGLDAGGLDAGGIDAGGGDAGSPCSITYGATTRVDSLSTLFDETATFPTDLVAYVGSPADFQGFKLYRAERTTPTGTFGALVGLDEINTYSPFVFATGRTGLGLPAVSVDEQAMVISVVVGTESEPHDLWGTSRASAGDTWDPPVELTGVSSLGYDIDPGFDGDGNLWFASNRSGGWEVYVAAPDGGGGFMAPMRATELSSSGDARGPVLSADGLRIFFASTRAGGVGDFDIWTACRASSADAFMEPVRVGGDVGSAAEDAPSSLSADGSRLYLSSRRLGNNDVYVAERM